MGASIEAHPFYQYFQKVYGERWPVLFASLQVKEQQVARWNQFITSWESSREKAALKNDESLLPGCSWLAEGEHYHPQRAEGDLLDAYIMDPGSVFVARALETQPGDRVLDMCAAPGGKTLILAESLREAGELFCNDLSPERRERLKKVIQQYIPREVRDRVWVQGKDAVQFGLREPESFDRILLDAPCSGERHVLENPKALADWGPRRTEHQAARQYSLISAAFLALKAGGRLVYSTCSISPKENDEIVLKLLKKKKGAIQLVETPLPHACAEKTDCGYIFLPDRCGFGPLYYSVLQK